MAKIFPFRGIRFNREKIPDLSSVIAPPYDVISREQEKILRARSPHNTVRLILGDPSELTEEERSDLGRYQEAARTLSTWRKEGVLLQDREPSLYLCEETFTWKEETFTRRGLLATVETTPFSSGEILPHEQTLAAPLEDRLHLLEATQTHTGPSYMLCDDPTGEIGAALEKATTSSEALSFRNPDQEIHYRLWQLVDTKVIDHLSHLFASRPLLIADGHHRYTIAQRYAETKKKNSSEIGHMLTYIVPTPHPGVILSAIHRIITSPIQKSSLLEKLAQIGTLKKEPFSFEQFQESKAPLAFLFPTAEEIYLFRPNPDQKSSTVPTVLLNKEILKPLLDIDMTQKGDQGKIDFAKDPAKVSAKVNSGQGFGVWVRAMTVSDVFAVAQEGEVLPQKSTFFYPKIPSGIVFHTLENHA